MAWLLILLAVVGLLVSAQYERSRAPDPSPLAGEVTFEVQAKAYYASSRLDGGRAAAGQQAIFRELATTPGMAWRVAALLAGTDRREGVIADEILPMVSRFDGEVASLGREADLLHRAVKEALESPAQLSTDQRQLLIDELGWFGHVLLSHAAGSQNPDRLAALREASPVMWTSVGVFVVGALALLVGSILFILKLVTHIMKHGELRVVMHHTVAPAGIYLEAVAVYLLLALILPAAVGVIPGTAGSIAVEFGLLAFSSVTGVLWPFLRHRSASEVAADLGLNLGRGFWREFGAGLIGYLTALPILFVGIVITVLLILLYSNLATQYGWDTDAAQGPIAPHPVVQWIAAGPLWIRVLVFLLAAGFAPFFEEIVFRGALLNGAARTIQLAPGLLVMAFIFAVIHPQGWMAVPALMSIAVGLALIRLWRRGCLVAPMVAHALHNGTLVCVMILLFG